VMTRPGPGARGSGPADGDGHDEPRDAQNESWSVFGYLISGMAV
jgi:hypothetical protein